MPEPDATEEEAGAVFTWGGRRYGFAGAGAV